MTAAWAALALAPAAVLALLLMRSRRQAALLEARLMRDARSLELLQLSFARFAPRQVVEDIIARGVSTNACKREVTVLFADIKGFTAMSERLDPAVLVEILNGYFKAMSRAVTENKGHVSKFIGDGMMALFGVPEPNPWQANDAAKAALAMTASLAGYNEKLAAQGLPKLSIGIGIHRGTAVAGVIGSEELMEYTVIGGAVNLAARIESLTRQHGVDILVTEPVRAALDPRFQLREFPAAAVKGIAEPVRTYAVDGLGS